jgi:1-aminocyclopropane-1-carboxylate deaminase
MQKIGTQHIKSFSTSDVGVDILRLDQIHPVVSGNKWFKLTYYLRDALAERYDTIATFGGAYSNHIVATAFAANEKRLKSIGYIRGDAPAFSPTLEEAASYGMELHFVDRALYRDKISIMARETGPGKYWIMEGGYGVRGAEGAADILRCAETSHYSHILCAVGTGTMMAGLIKGAGQKQQVTGISVLKNHFALANEVMHLLDDTEKQKHFTILHDYHGGGYAKYSPELIELMRRIWETEQIPTDIVYTSKLIFAAQDLVRKNHFPAGSSVLLIHSGGLQGNRSLPAGTLPF